MSQTVKSSLGLVRAGLFILGIFPAFVFAQTERVQTNLSKERLERLSGVLQHYVDTERIPGAVTLVVHRGQVAYLKAFGFRDREAVVPQRTDDIFRIASQTKAIVSVAIMLLQEEGRLLISDPVGRYIPEFLETTVAVPEDRGWRPDGYEVVVADRPITIRDLLTHTSGIGYGYGVASDRWEEAGLQGWYFAHRHEPMRETVRRMAGLPFDAHPGEAFVYGYSTDVLGAVIEMVAGVMLDEFLEARIFGPLGMLDTHFYLPEEKHDRLAVVYSLDERGLTRAPNAGGIDDMVSQGAYVDGPRRSFSGGAGLLSTAEDYARFLQMMLNGGELDGVRILSRKTVELMTVNHVGGLRGEELGNSGVGFGLGFDVLEDLGERGTPGSVGEFGWGGAYHSVYWVDPTEQLIVVYFTQLNPANDLDDHAKLRTLVYQAVIDN